jgi:cytochrome P450
MLGAAMSEAKAVSWWDILRLQCFVTFPAALWGVVAPNRWLVPLVVRFDLARHAHSFLAGLRERYGNGPLRVWLPLRATVLLLDFESIDALLASKANAADPWLKKRALSCLVPDGVIVSSGAPWWERRQYNEGVLATHRPHPHREAFAAIAAEEVERLLAAASPTLGWRDFTALAERIAHQVFLGAGGVEPAMSAQLASLAAFANAGVRHPLAFRRFYARLQGHLHHPSAQPCLLQSATRRAATALTQVPSQATFWLFVLKDAVELHVARTLVLLAAHPPAQQRAREEAGADPATPAAIEEMAYLDDCVLEQLRLWTPVPLLLRRARADFSLPGATTVHAGQQILAHAGFHHRDARRFGTRADRFEPEAVASGPPLLVFSRHHQACAGETLIRFVLKATLAALLARARFTLRHPALDSARLPLQIDHFALRLQWQRTTAATRD